MSLGIGLIGSGFIGRVHALAYRAAPAVFGIESPRLVALADVDPGAEASATEFGFDGFTTDWRELLADDAVDVIDIATPNRFHEAMALESIAAGKHVYCEKPLAPTAEGADRMAAAATDAGVKTMVGFNYLKNPITALARDIIASGEIGEVFGFRSWHFEDYMLDPDTLVNPWRLDPAEGDGVTSDLGSHAIARARFLVEPITEVSAARTTVVAERPSTTGAVQVEVPDTVSALIRFEGGATGTLEASWMAAGRKHTIAVEVWGSKGSLAFDFERLNELRLYRTGNPAGRDGVTTILAGPDLPDYAPFVPAPGHQLGFNDLKTIEVRDLLVGMEGDGPWPDFAEGAAVQRVVDAIVTSDRSGGWVTVD